MKLRKVVLMLMLAALLATALVVPVAADRRPHEFSFTQANITEPWDCRLVGKVWQCSAHAEYTLVSEDPLLDGAFGTAETKCVAAIMARPPAWWGPCSGSWRIVTLLPGEESGWEGTYHMNPWTDPTKWPRTGMLYFTGNGFGEYRNTQTKFSTDSNASVRVFAGEIYGLD
jgi:hypothetical protein